MLATEIVLDSTMREEDIFREIRAVFKKPMDSNPNFAFKVLQPTGGGSKMLNIPTVSDSFSGPPVAWVGKVPNLLFISWPWTT